MAKWPLAQQERSRIGTNTHRNFQQVFWEVGMLAAACAPAGFLTQIPQKSTVKRVLCLGLGALCCPCLELFWLWCGSELTKIHPVERSPVSCEWILYQSSPVAMKLGLPMGEKLLLGFWGMFVMGFSLCLFLFFFQISLWINVLKQNFYFWSL